MQVQLKRRAITKEAYCLMIEHGILTEYDKVELLNGEIIEMSPIGSLHAAVVNQIVECFFERLSKKVIVSVQNPLDIGGNSLPESDIILLKRKENHYTQSHPLASDALLVVEVSGSTFEKDKYVKVPLYAQAEIPQAWIVNLQENEIEVYRNPKDGRYKNIEIISSTDSVTVDCFGQSFAASELLPS